MTTETGLVIALPGLFFQYQMTRTFERYKAFLAHLETVCAQELHRAESARAAARHVAWQDIGLTLREALASMEIEQAAEETEDDDERPTAEEAEPVDDDLLPRPADDGGDNGSPRTDPDDATDAAIRAAENTNCPTL